MKKIRKLVAIMLIFAIMTSMDVSVFADNQEEKALTKDNLVSTQQELNEGIYKFSYNQNQGEEIIKNEIVYYVNEEKKIKEMNNYIRQRASYNYRSTLDSTMSYEHYTKVYYSESGNRVKVTKVEGGYTRRDQTVSVVGQKVVIGQGNMSSSTSTTKNPSSSSWSYTTTSWPYIDVTAGAVVGAYYILTLKRNAGSWESEVDNYIYNNFSMTW